MLLVGLVGVFGGVVVIFVSHQGELKTQDTCRVSKSRTAAVIQLFVETVSLGQFSLFVFSIGFQMSMSQTAGAAAAVEVQQRSYQQQREYRASRNS